MRSSPVGNEKALIFSGGATDGDGPGDILVALEGVATGDGAGVLPEIGEKVAMGLATATGDESTSIDGVGAVDVGARPHADKTTTSPMMVARATRPSRLSNPNLSGPEV